MTTKSEQAFHGLLVIDKPWEMTSRDVVNRAQNWFPKRTRIGHAGTLDPLATGVLVLCVGSATRLIEYVQRMSKVYRTTAILGQTSTTDDAEGEITPIENARIPTREEIEQRLLEFLGEIEQVPPAYSAAKVSGQRAHKLARKGRAVSLEAKTVRIDRLETLRYEWPELDLKMQCGKGTYVRSVVRDLGERLECGGYVGTLRRASIGAFTTEKGLTPDVDRETARSALLPITMALTELPQITPVEADLQRLRHGNPVSFQGTVESECAIFDQEKNLIAIATYNEQQGELSPVKVFTTG